MPKVGYIGKVVSRPRWDYAIGKEELTDGEKEVIIRSGLRIYSSSD